MSTTGHFTITTIKTSIKCTLYTEAMAESRAYRTVGDGWSEVPRFDSHCNRNVFRFSLLPYNFKTSFNFRAFFQNWVNESNMSQLAREKQVNLGTVQISFGDACFCVDQNSSTFFNTKYSVPLHSESSSRSLLNSLFPVSMEFTPRSSSFSWVYNI